jgi:hypothetical protein
MHSRSLLLAPALVASALAHIAIVRDTIGERPRRMDPSAVGILKPMPLVCPDAGEVLLANNWLNKVAPQNQTLKLYSNNITPAETDTAGTYTEAAFTGYAAIGLTGADWTVTSGAPTSAATAAKTFTQTAVASSNVYGYFIVQAVSGIIMVAERFSAAPFALANNGDSITVTPTITFD